MLTAVLLFPLIALFLAVISMPLWLPIAKKPLSDRKWFYASLRDRSALGRRRARNTWKVYVQPGPDDKDLNERVAYYKSKGKDSPVRIELVKGKDALVWIGLPLFGYETVAPWYYTADLKDAANDEHHTLPLKEQTTLFPMALPEGTEKQELLVKVAEAKKTGKPLMADEVRKLMAMDPQNSAEGFEIKFDLEADWQIVDPVKFLLGHEFVGDLMVSLFNNGARLGMSGLRLIPVETDSTTPSAETLTREFERRTQLYLGVQPWDEEYAKHENMSPMPEVSRAVMVLAEKGIKLMRIRIRNLLLPPDVMELLKKPAEARAQATADLTAADVRAQAAVKDADALRHKGEGEKDYNVTIATGRKEATVIEATGRQEAAKLDAAADVSRIGAWDPTKVGAAAVAARLHQLEIGAWQDGVKSPGAGKVIITGAPGSSTGSGGLEGLAATVTSVIKEVGSPADKPGGGKDNTPPAGESKDEPPAA